MNNFEYISPASIKEASAKYKKTETPVSFMSGGTDLLGMMKYGQINPDRVINLKKIAGLDKIEHIAGKGLKIGAMTKLSRIADNKIIREKYTALSDAALKVAAPQIRNMATLGGNICQRPRCWYYRENFDCIRNNGGECFAYEGENKFHCIVGGGPCYIVHPSDTAVALLALGAEFIIFTEGKEKTVKAENFFILPEDDPLKENILEPGDVLTHIIIPESPAAISGYLKIMERGSWDFALVSVAVSLNITGKTINSGKAVFGGVAPAPWIEKSISLENLSLEQSSIDKRTENAFAGAEVLTKNGYKVQMAKNALKKLLLSFA